MGAGFLGYPSTLMLDVVVVALALVVPLLLVSLYLVKIARNYTAHRNLQILLGGLLLVTVGLFELDMRLQGGWQAILKNRDVQLSPERLSLVSQVLFVHLGFAVSTCILWTVTLIWAWRAYPNPPVPMSHSKTHKLLGWLSMLDITLTSVTGLAFYYLAFVS